MSDRCECDDPEDIYQEAYKRGWDDALKHAPDIETVLTGVSPEAWEAMRRLEPRSGDIPTIMRMIGILNDE
ncbi:hypothetical protein GCM10009560_79350 [Nonomuraea longicatena]|uniref:Uncharacterized protein n=1 Tax=Nonomuraea longicatena TaxID=83682 RepID=A0ABN1RE26_9ACTN